MGRKGGCLQTLEGGYHKKGPDILLHLYNVIITTLSYKYKRYFFKRINVMAQTYRNSMPFSYQVRWKLKSHYAKKLLAVCGMMTFDPKYSFESPFANIWGNNLFESDSLSFDLIKIDTRSSDPFSSWTYNKVTIYF